jgi:hypothetical protein
VRAAEEAAVITVAAGVAVVMAATPISTSADRAVAAVADRDMLSRAQQTYACGEDGKTQTPTGLWLLVGNEQHAL